MYCKKVYKDETARRQHWESSSLQGNHPEYFYGDTDEEREDTAEEEQRKKKLRKRRREFAEKFQMWKKKNTFVKFSLSKIKEMGLEDILTKMDFTTLAILRIALSMALVLNITLMDLSRIKANGRMENFYINDFIII